MPQKRNQLLEGQATQNRWYNRVLFRECNIATPDAVNVHFCS